MQPIFYFFISMDKIPLQFLASIENNTERPNIFSGCNIENDLPLIMSAIEQNLSLKEEKTDICLPTEDDDSDDEDEETPGCSSSPCNRVQRRRSSRTKSLDSKLHKIKRRTITKPTRIQINLNASENEIRNYYMINSKKIDMKPSNLETIFEEGSPAVDKCKFFGMRKLRRSLNCFDGCNVNKATTKARKTRVRKLLGSAPKLERMTMDTFLERLKSLQNESDEDTTPTV
ncbi:uncharacterized protein LOC129774539 isoform X2 [Toxorhynchites rutilus septentrionalis]|uniref:uncharacterized protein LOC129774539 isoform X2 n=1 Tax=Toxorhynchites rutilus septentrionalis TaxID=329112 RepID=UPI0024796526|nr:uncharacterized protein LOC129774539 isoform X2 [Toxorhynchites rutilus septentrionalis]